MAIIQIWQLDYLPRPIPEFVSLDYYCKFDFSTFRKVYLVEINPNHSCFGSARASDSKIIFYLALRGVYKPIKLYDGKKPEVV